MEDVNLDINFIDPSEDYFHHVKYLLMSYIEVEPFKYSNLADLLIKQVKSHISYK
jgi:hypothetical protein